MSTRVRPRACSGQHRQRIHSFVYPDDYVLVVELCVFRKILLVLMRTCVNMTTTQLHTVFCIAFTDGHVFQETLQLKQKVTWVEVEINTNEAAPIPTSRTIALLH